jgi:uncharacterized SAM-binding protein YcdF (DUF218 family)
MRTFFSTLIMPLPVFFLLLLVSTLLYWRKRKKWAGIFFAFSFFWLLLVSTPWIPQLLIKSLEKQYAPLLHVPQNLPDSGVNILVLGCGHTNDLSLPWTGQLATQELGRVVEGVRLYKMIPGSKLVLSASNVDDHFSQAETAARAALLLGVSPEDTLHLPTPRNTWEEAMAYRERFGAESVETHGDAFETHRRASLQILVTDAMHMPRAMMLFRMAGLDPIPAPTNFIIKEGKNPKSPDWWPAPGNIAMFGKAVHEYMGIVWGKVEK